MTPSRWLRYLSRSGQALKEWLLLFARALGLTLACAVTVAPIIALVYVVILKVWGR